MEKNIYIKSLLKKQLIIKPEYINKNINNNIIEILKDNVGDKCTKDGYIQKDSINIMKKSTAKLMTHNFSGNLIIDVQYSANICNPVRGNIINCKITHINKFGIQAENFPLSVIVAKQYHNNKELFKNLNIGQDIDILVIGKRYSLNNNVIDIIGKLANDKNTEKFINTNDDNNDENKLYSDEINNNNDDDDENLLTEDYETYTADSDAGDLDSDAGDLDSDAGDLDSDVGDLDSDDGDLDSDLDSDDGDLDSDVGDLDSDVES